MLALNVKKKEKTKGTPDETKNKKPFYRIMSGLFDERDLFKNLLQNEFNKNININKIYEKHLRDAQLYNTHKNNNSYDKKLIKEGSVLTFEFENKRQKEKFERDVKTNEKLQNILQAIKEDPAGTTGIGKPEVLKKEYRGFKGAISRRIDQENRIVYKTKKSGEILILDFEGHYENKKKPWKKDKDKQ